MGLVQKGDEQYKTSKTIRRYVKRRDKVVLSMDVDKFRKFIRKTDPDIKQPSDEVLEITLRKMALSIRSMPEDVQNDAREWLVDHGCEPEGME